jgi:RNA polymerase sigma-70 factor (ECF subfamily)
MSGPAEAEAVVMEVYCRAYRAFQGSTDADLLKRWLFELWWQVCLDTWRRQHQHSILQARPLPPPIRVALTSLPEATIDLSANDARTIIHQAIENLPIGWRIVVILADIEGFSSQDMATIVKCPVDLVAARLHRARRRLCDQLRNDLKPAESNP